MENIVTRSISFDKEVFEKMESARGLTHRSTFVNAAIRKALAEGLPARWGKDKNTGTKNEESEKHLTFL